MAQQSLDQTQEVFFLYFLNAVLVYHILHICKFSFPNFNYTNWRLNMLHLCDYDIEVSISEFDPKITILLYDPQ